MRSRAMLALILTAMGCVPASAELRREIADPCLGTRWELQLDAAHPGRPGRLVLASVPPTHALRTLPRRRSRDFGANLMPAQAPPAVIRVGDRVTVVQSSPVLQARFQALALQAGAVGEAVQVRLLAGGPAPLGAQGPVIVVQATGIGQARWLAAEARVR